MQADIQVKTKHAAEVAGKIASYASLWVAVSLLFGAMLARFAAGMAALVARNAPNPFGG